MCMGLVAESGRKLGLKKNVGLLGLRERICLRDCQF